MSGVRSGYSRFFGGLLAGILMVQFTACTSTGDRQPTATGMETPAYAETLMAPIPTTGFATPLLPESTPSGAEATQSSDPLAGQIPSPAPDPLRFVFPSPGPAPVSAWRPPLYAIPWAPTPFDHFFFSRPIAADEVNWPLADYRYGGIFFENVIHTGVDIPVLNGTPVLAAGAGRIVWAGYGIYRGGNDPTDPYGLAVVIRHDFGYEGQTLFTLYGHLDEIDVADGQHVEAGDPLGLSGETGRVTGPHLHFEIRLGENNYFMSRNPELWLAPPVGWGILAARVMDTSGYLLDEPQLFIVTSRATRQNWTARTYGFGGVNSDPYYRENLVIGDLPAGLYDIRTAYGGQSYEIEMEIRPGVVNYFTFKGFNGFTVEPPPLPGEDFTPGAMETPSP